MRFLTSSLILGLSPALSLAQYPAEPKGSTVVKSFVDGVQISFKEVWMLLNKVEDDN